MKFKVKNQNQKSLCPIVNMVRVESIKEFTRKDNGEKFYKMRLSIIALEDGKPVICDGVFPCTFNAVEGLTPPVVGEVAFVTVRPWYDFNNGYKIRYAVNFFHAKEYGEKYKVSDAVEECTLIQEELN